MMTAKAFLRKSLLILLGTLYTATAMAQSCPSVSCTHSLPSATWGFVTINPGEVYCVPSGNSWTGGLKLNGGTLYIAEGASFKATWVDGRMSGTIINCGSLEIPFYEVYPGRHTVTITNYGTSTFPALQNYEGTFANYGTVDATHLVATNSVITNHRLFKVNQMTMHSTLVTNFDSLVVNNNFVLNPGGKLENKASGVASLNMTVGSTTLLSPVDNSGRMFIRYANSGGGISTVVNNYGEMKIYNAVILGAQTYLTNDSLLEFINISSVELQGPMLQNNSRLRVTHGNLSLNSPISQMVNNGIVTVSGEVSHNVEGSKVINTCRIVSGSYFVGNGISENKGLIWVTGKFKVEGLESVIRNDASGHIRGKHFRNSGHVSGYGSFYFTDSTDFQSAGVIAGNSADNPILFFDASQTNDQVFDLFNPANPAVNTIRPNSMTPLDTTAYVCGAPPSTAGYPPSTQAISASLCSANPLTLNLHEYVTAHAPVSGQSFTVQYASVKLFEHLNAGNPTNNSTMLVVPGRGTFQVNTTTGVLTFTPDPGFTSGSVSAQYRISNIRAGDPISYPSSKTMITITFGNNISTPPISAEAY